MYHWFVWDGDKIAEESYINTNFSAYFHWYYDYGHYDSYVPSYVWTTRDGLGSPRELYSGQYNLLLMQYDYAPYGRQSTLVSSYQTPPDFRFAGMLGMPGHNLEFAENRVYDPDLGRWTSRDPSGEIGGLNLYEYAANDPFDNVDPDGLCPQLGTILGEGQYRDVNGDIRDENGDLVKDQLNPLNPINFEGNSKLDGLSKIPRPPDSPFYSVVMEAKLKPGTFMASDRNHFRQANQQLYRLIQSDPDLAARLEAEFPGITSHAAPGPRGGFSDESPPGLTWHHDPAIPGNLQLVPYDQHRAPGPVQSVLHPNQQGGRELWGGGR